MPDIPAEEDTLARTARVRFVLVEPQQAGNVGSAARALKNLGFARLCLVAPRCDPLGDEARKLAREAVDLLETAEVFDDLDGALAGAATALATSRRTGKQRKPHWRLDQLAPELPRLLEAGELAVMLGREAHGLSDAELDRATHLIHFPAAEAYPSFNLAQSVLLVAYQLRLAAEQQPPEDALEPPAEHGEREEMYEHLEHALRTVGFLHEQSAEPMMRRIRRMLGRASMTPEEVKILRGIARQTLWAARQAGLPEAGEDD